MITVNCVPLTVCIVAWPDWPIESTSTRNSATPTPPPPPSPRATGHWQAHSHSDANARGGERDHESYNIYRTAHIAMSHPSHRRLHGRETRPRPRHWQMCRWERSMVERTGGPGLRCIIGSMYVLRPSSAHCTDWVAPGPWMTSAANKVRHRSCERFHALRRWDDGIRVEGRAHVIAPSRQTTDQYPT